MLSTVLTSKWGLRHPIVQAPMAGVAGGRLAAAVSATGGLGFLGVGPTTSVQWLATEAGVARTAGRFGIGLLVWVLQEQPGQFEATLAERPFAISLSAGDPAPYVRRAQDAGCVVFAQVSDRPGALRALAAGVDVLVAQGTEAGGHTGFVATLPLLQIVLEVAEPANVPVLAAGGIATGRALAGVLAMGAAGAWVGTRFVACEEALGSQAAKQALISADETSTVLTHVFDIVQGLDWPDAYPGRALGNRFTDRWHGHESGLADDLTAVRPAFDEARAREDFSEGHIYAGQAVGLIKDLPAAGELVARLSADAEARLLASKAILAES